MNNKLIKIYTELTRILPDQAYLKLSYFLNMKKMLNIKNPKTYNEKLQHLKLVQVGKKFTDWSDKYEARKLVEKKIGKEYLTKLYWVGIEPEKIPFNDLPSSFVIKCNHGSGYNLIVPEKTKLNKLKTIKTVKSWMKDDFWKRGREYNYKHMKKKIIIEEYLGKNINDYKFLCFHGKPKFMFIATDRGIDTKFDFFDMKFNHLPFKQGYENNTKKLKKPKLFEKMIKISKKLSEGFPHVRVDLYEINNKLYFGELTFYHFSGWKRFRPDNDKIDLEWGNLIKLENEK